MEEKITPLEAYKAMIIFLDEYHYRFGQDSVASVLGSIHLIDENRTADPAAWEDWLEAVNKVVQEK